MAARVASTDWRPTLRTETQSPRSLVARFRSWLRARAQARAEAEARLCTNCHGDGCYEMWADFYTNLVSVTCERCGGSGVDPTADERVRELAHA